VNEFADYGGLNSAPEIASRRFVAKYAIDEKFKEILNPEEVILLSILFFFRLCNISKSHEVDNMGSFFLTFIRIIMLTIFYFA